jgi:hypothetical protein
MSPLNLFHIPTCGILFCLKRLSDGLQDFFNTFQKHVTAKRQETKNIREETRKVFKWDIDQASRQYLVQHEKKSEVIMHHARTKQTEEYRHACREIQKEYKRKISQKYDDLETDSMQFADQAILDLRELLNQEKNNILTEVAQDLPNTILTTIKTELTAQLDTTVATHTEALKEQRKQITTQIQKIAKRHREQMVAQQDTEEDQINETIKTIKDKAWIAFSLELQAQVNQKPLPFGNLTQPKPALATPPAPGYKSHVPLTSNYWAETLHSPSVPARPSPETPGTSSRPIQVCPQQRTRSKAPELLQGSNVHPFA